MDLRVFRIEILEEWLDMKGDRCGRDECLVCLRRSRDSYGEEEGCGEGVCV